MLCKVQCNFNHKLLPHIYIYIYTGEGLTYNKLNVICVGLHAVIKRTVLVLGIIKPNHFEHIRIFDSKQYEHRPYNDAYVYIFRNFFVFSIHSFLFLIRNTISINSSTTQQQFCTKQVRLISLAVFAQTGHAKRETKATYNTPPQMYTSV